jgi:hypothetical protein
MATNTTPATDAPALEADAPAVTHDRSTTPVGAGRITFKGHNAKAGYPYRIYEGRVEALVDGAWVEAVDSVPLEG